MCDIRHCLTLLTLFLPCFAVLDPDTAAAPALDSMSLYIQYNIILYCQKTYYYKCCFVLHTFKVCLLL